MSDSGLTTFEFTSKDGNSKAKIVDIPPDELRAIRKALQTRERELVKAGFLEEE